MSIARCSGLLVRICGVTLSCCMLQLFAVFPSYLPDCFNRFVG